MESLAEIEDNKVIIGQPTRYRQWIGHWRQKTFCFIMAQKVSLLDYAKLHNPVTTRRGKKMTFSYLYRIIRENEAGQNKYGGKPRALWFRYEFEGEKDRIWIVLN